MFGHRGPQPGGYGPFLQRHGLLPATPPGGGVFRPPAIRPDGQGTFQPPAIQPGGGFVQRPPMQGPVSGWRLRR